MANTTTAGRQLHVQRFRARYLVSAEHPAPERVKARLDESLARSLPRTLAAMLSAGSSSSGPGLWFVRRLELDVDVNAAWDREQVGRQWAARIVRECASTVQGGQDGDNVAHFADHATYLARFLADLAAGRAWSKWYYAAFGGLRMLPVSAALRSAIVDHPGRGLAALLQLAPQERAGVLRALSPQDADRILLRITGDAPAGDETRCFQALWAAWDAAELGPLQAAEEGRNGLRLTLRVCEEQPGLAGPTLRAGALALLRLARRLASSGRELLAALSSGELATLCRVAGAADAQVLAPLLRCAPHWVRAVGGALLARQQGAIVPEKTAPGAVRHTSFGGALLLLPFLDALPLDEATRGWPDADELDALALARFLILVKCCGAERAQQMFFDPLLRDLLGVPPALIPAAAARWAGCLSPADVARFLEALSAWGRREGAVSGHALALLSVPASGARVALLLDGQRGMWLLARGYRSGQLGPLLAALRPWLSQIDPLEGILLCDDAFAPAVRAAYPGLAIEPPDSPAAVERAGGQLGLKETLARRDRLPGDLAYLALPRQYRGSRTFDLALSVAAQAVLRAFAWRLPGFAGSSLPHLYHNFLAFGAAVEDELTRRVVRLGRPPLNLVLNITGLARGSYHLSWLDERPLALFQEG